MLCQRDNASPSYFSCAVSENAIWTLPDPWGRQKWSIIAVGGQSWRMTNITFIVDAAVETPEAAFLAEDPYLQYNLVVRGKCIGQPGCGGKLEPGYESPLRDL